jgi:hypothetical protein
MNFVRNVQQMAPQVTPQAMREIPLEREWGSAPRVEYVTKTVNFWERPEDIREANFESIEDKEVDLKYLDESEEMDSGEEEGEDVKVLKEEEFKVGKSKDDKKNEDRNTRAQSEFKSNGKLRIYKFKISCYNNYQI